MEAPDTLRWTLFAAVGCNAFLYAAPFFLPDVERKIARTVSSILTPFVSHYINRQARTLEGTIYEDFADKLVSLSLGFGVVNGLLAFAEDTEISRSVKKFTREGMSFYSRLISHPPIPSLLPAQIPISPLQPLATIIQPAVRAGLGLLSILANRLVSTVP